MKLDSDRFTERQGRSPMKRSLPQKDAAKSPKKAKLVAQHSELLLFTATFVGLSAGSTILFFSPLSDFSRLMHQIQTVCDSQSKM